jgi:hypothetical protein
MPFVALLSLTLVVVVITAAVVDINDTEDDD